MIETLTIENYALIERSEIALANGFTAITGETGAGKSILLGALGLLLGQRADVQALGEKDRKCVIEGSFEIEGLGLEAWFEENDLDYEATLTVRREVLPTGKSRAFINDTPATLVQLKELAPHLVDIHSQHETLLLNEATFRTQLIDSYAQDTELKEEYQEQYKEYQRLKRELEQLTGAEQRSREEADYLQYQYKELQEAQLTAGEQETLEEESELLQHAESIKEAFAAVIGLCECEERGAIGQMNAARVQLSKIAGCNKSIEELYKRMESCVIELQDIIEEVERKDEEIQYSPEHQAAVDERLDQLYGLERKHHVENVEELIALREKIGKKIQTFGTMEEEIRQTMEAVDIAYGKMQKAAKRLTEARRKAAEAIVSEIVPTLADLGMKEARMRIEVGASDHYGEMGCDEIRILFNANQGHEMQEIAKIASGGEMSRIMLALKSHITQATLLPTIIFDEIDTGISGDISVKTGAILQRMACQKQVIVITHTPQIAALANEHLKVYKHNEVRGEGHRTVSRIKRLSEVERLSEIAKMLSSEHPTEAALQTAKELMKGGEERKEREG